MMKLTPLHLSNIPSLPAHQTNSWVIKSTATASSSPSPSPLRPPSCSPTTSPCFSKALESPFLLTFHPNQCLTLTPASHHGTPSLSGTRMQAWGCQFVSLCTCFFFCFCFTVELESPWRIPKCLPECVHKNGCRGCLFFSASIQLPVA